MTTRRTLVRALAALAALPLFGKAVEAEAAPDAAVECAAQGGDFKRLSETEWRCALPDNDDLMRETWVLHGDFVPPEQRTIQRSLRDY